MSASASTTCSTFINSCTRYIPLRPCHNCRSRCDSTGCSRHSGSGAGLLFKSHRNNTRAVTARRCPPEIFSRRFIPPLAPCSGVCNLIYLVHLRIVIRSLEYPVPNRANSFTSVGGIIGSNPFSTILLMAYIMMPITSNTPSFLTIISAESAHLGALLKIQNSSDVPSCHVVLRREIELLRFVRPVVIGTQRNTSLFSLSSLPTGHPEK